MSLNQNDAQVVAQLKEKLNNLFNMDPEERQRLLTKTKIDFGEKSPQVTALQKLKDAKKQKQKNMEEGTKSPEST